MTKMSRFDTVPLGALQKPSPFKLSIPEAKLQAFQKLLELSPLAKETHENLQRDGKYGVTRDWMVDTKKYWTDSFDWREQEKRINSYPSFQTEITDDNEAKIGIYFTALFSKNPSALPIAFLHGWPGSFIEFLPILDIIASQYTPETLPYHIIVPSLPGYPLSSGPPLDSDWGFTDMARIMHKLLLSLGFGETGYIVQGGDFGSYVSRIMAATYSECKGAHVNFLFPLAGGSMAGPEANLTDLELQEVGRIKMTLSGQGLGYVTLQGNFPSTIGFVLASSPIAHLAWIGEKFLNWSDPRTTPSLDQILTNITLYWLTDSYPSSIYTYRRPWSFAFVHKPTGYSAFPRELAVVPKSWATEAANVVQYKSHEKGGHFAALENPKALWGDVEEFVKVVRK